MMTDPYRSQGRTPCMTLPYKFKRKTAWDRIRPVAADLLWLATIAYVGGSVLFTTAILMRWI